MEDEDQRNRRSSQGGNGWLAEGWFEQPIGASAVSGRMIAVTGRTPKRVAIVNWWSDSPRFESRNDVSQ